MVQRPLKSDKRPKTFNIANLDIRHIRRMLRTWLAEHSPSEWPEGYRITQLAITEAYNRHMSRNNTTENPSADPAPNDSSSDGANQDRSPSPSSRSSANRSPGRSPSADRSPSAEP